MQRNCRKPHIRNTDRLFWVLLSRLWNNWKDALLKQLYYNTQDAATLLGVSDRWLERLRVIGGGPTFYKFGRRCLYSRADLDTWAEARRRRSTSDTGEVAQ